MHVHWHLVIYSLVWQKQANDALPSFFLGRKKYWWAPVNMVFRNSAKYRPRFIKQTYNFVQKLLKFFKL
jgi:hypothetical protein